jgi:hypothetical protein
MPGGSKQKGTLRLENDREGSSEQPKGQHSHGPKAPRNLTPGGFGWHRRRTRMHWTTGSNKVILDIPVALSTRKGIRVSVLAAKKTLNI